MAHRNEIEDIWAISRFRLHQAHTLKGWHNKLLGLLFHKGFKLSLAEPDLSEAHEDLSSRQGEIVIKGILKRDKPEVIWEAALKAAGRSPAEGLVSRAKVFEAFSAGLTEPEAVMVGMLADTLSLYRKSLESLEKLLEERMLEIGLERQLLLMETIPGVTRTRAMTVLAELYCNFSRYTSVGALASFAGLAKADWRKLGQKNQDFDSKDYNHLIDVLREIVLASIQKPGDLQQRYLDMLPRKGQATTIAANSARMLRIMWNMLRNNKPFSENPERPSGQWQPSERD